MAIVINLLLKSNYQNAVRFYIPCTFWVSVIKGLENVSFWAQTHTLYLQ